jgi:mannose-1-phosphate guanylyltransferase/mannose-6-phosphate isomerase
MESRKLQNIDQTETMVRPLILCGGAGSRLWPLSRTLYPKQLSNLSGEGSLLQNTVRRVSGAGFLKPILVTGEEHRFLIRDQLEAVGLEPECIILESNGRNTAPAIALAAEWLAQHHPDETLLVLPADHVIGDDQAFKAAVSAALRASDPKKLLTFGIKPRGPATGFGYIEVATSGGGVPQPAAVLRFVEKPGLEKAREFINSGGYYWNSGMFLFQADAFLAELRSHAPEIAEWARGAVATGQADALFFRPSEDGGTSCPAISVDCAVMEKSTNIHMVPTDMAWSDVGSWEGVWELSDHDLNGNSFRGEVVAIDTSGTLVRSDGDATIATVGVKDLAIVATKDAILIASRDRAEDVREVVQVLRARGDTTTELPAIVHRPWGTYQTIGRDARSQTKRIIVKPGAKLSLQLHHHRSEHWVVVSGTAEVTVGETTQLLHENQSTYISAGTFHRLANPGKVPLHLIEVQCGTYLGEDDIVRFEDDYGRNTDGSKG